MQLINIDNKKMDNKEIIKNFTSLLCKYNVCLKDDFKGLNLKEIKSVEKNLNIKFPDIYKEFLLKLGKSAGCYQRNSHFFIDFLLDLQDVSQKFNISRANDYSLDKIWIFYRSPSGEFLFFPTDQGDDPPIYGYTFDEYSKKYILELERLHSIVYVKKIKPFFYKKNGDKFYSSFSSYLFNEIERVFLESLRKLYISDSLQIAKRYFNIEKEEDDYLFYN